MTDLRLARLLRCTYQDVQDLPADVYQVALEEATKDLTDAD